LLSTFGENPDGSSAGKLNRKSSAWWELTLNQLGAAIRTSFKLSTNPFKNPTLAEQWEPYVAERRESITAMRFQLSEIEANINRRVYRLFDLTESKIALLE
jgi:hypothetical protein